MRICFISDTHNLHHRITMMLRGGDVIVHSGDMTGRGTKPEIVEFLDWYKSLNYTHKIFIAGNHDWGFQDEPEFYKNLLKTQYPDLIYLEDSSVTIDGVKFYGSPWQPEFYNWAFNLPRNGWELEEKWKKIPLNTDVLITHGPPYGQLDSIEYNTESLGCELLMESVKIVKPYIHVFGHIHGGHGFRYNGTTNFINAAILTEHYSIGHGPYEFDWNVETGDLNIF